MKIHWGVAFLTLPSDGNKTALNSHGTVSSSEYVKSNGRLIGEQRDAKDVEGSGYDLISGTNSESAWRARKKPRKDTVITSSFRAKI
jgi:hypothetical protein